MVKTLQLGEQAIKRQLCIRPPVWYEASRKELHASEIESIKEAEEEAKARRIMLEEVAAVVRQLEEKAKEGKFQFLEYLYKTHPPKQTKFKNHTLRRDDASKKIMTIAIRQYHPDKNMREGEKWKLLCDHITKYLNGFCMS